MYAYVCKRMSVLLFQLPIAVSRGGMEMVVIILSLFWGLLGSVRQSSLRGSLVNAGRL